MVNFKDAILFKNNHRTSREENLNSANNQKIRYILCKRKKVSVKVRYKISQLFILPIVISTKKKTKSQVY